jgi:DnaA family protein
MSHTISPVNATQLTLMGMHTRDNATFDNFLIGKNELTLDFLSVFLTQQEQRYVYLWGKPGSGRTHLLQASAINAEKNGKKAICLPLLDIVALSPQMLENLEYYDLVCLDDIQAIVGNTEWEEAIFHLYNRLDQMQHHLLITGNVAPRELPVKLADLQSRLTAGTVFQLHLLTDDEKLNALQLRAQARGLHISDEVGHFLLRRSARSMSDLYGVLDKLDHASLAAQRRLTIPFVKLVLGL